MCWTVWFSLALKFLVFAPPGTPEDPSYQDQEALVFERNKRLLEPINLPLYFTNSILESGLPKSIREFRDNVQLSPEFVALCKRRLNWGLNNDSTLMKLPLDREFPYLDQTPPRVFGTPIGRKELSLLRTLYDLAQEWTSQHFGFNPNVFLQRVSHLNCVLPVDREEKLALFDLQSDFVTLLSSTNQKEASITPFDSNFVSSTSNKKLTSLAPISWELAFTPKHFYNTNYEFEIPAKSSIQTIFLSNQSLRLLDVDNYRGRCILFCYGMAAQQAKFKYQKELAEIQLEKPIQVQCVYTDPKEFQIGYVLLQLNTLDLDNSQIRNQVWFSEPRSVITNTADAIRDLITIQSRGIFEDAFSPTRM